MTNDPNLYGPGAESDREPLSRKQRALLYLNTPRRRFWAGICFSALSLVLSALFSGSDTVLLGLIPMLFLYGGGAVLVIFMTHGAALNKPPVLPVRFMRNTASARFSDEEMWESSLSPDQARDALVQLFQQPGTEALVVGRTVWVQLGKECRAEEWWHRDAAPHIKRKAPVQFFVGARGAGSTITAFSKDRRMFGLYDVLKLSDEMSATAVKLARRATERHTD